MIRPAEDFDFYHSFEKENPLRIAATFVAVITAFGSLFTALAAWVTHVVVCIKASAWILLVFGIVVTPIGIIHGIAVWFGLV